MPAATGSDKRMSITRIQGLIDAAAIKTDSDNSSNTGIDGPLRRAVIDVLRGIQDPELPVNIYDLGLIYALDILPANDSSDGSGAQVNIQMTLTAPGCPVAQSFPGIVSAAVQQLDGVESARVELVWDPPWCREQMSRQARYATGLW